MTRKNELIIQAVVFGMTAFIVSFLISRAYPAGLIKTLKNNKITSYKTKLLVEP